MILSIYAIACSYQDFRKGRIPNILHILFLIYLIATFQINITIYAVIVAIFLLPLYYFKLFGAGDIKLFSIVCAYMGIVTTLKVFLVSALFCLIVSGIKMAINNELLPRLYYLKDYFISLLNKSNFKYNNNRYIVRFGFYFGIITAIFNYENISYIR